jgi:chorismate mutase
MGNRKYLVLGPCAAESREQVMETASLVCDLRFQISNLIFRAGVWKPRTRPDTFQGVGEEGLGWLQEVKERFGIPVATEVATPEHVEAALKAGIDYLWIGARSSANPIVVQSICSAILDLRLKIEDFRLKGVLIKNPVNADAALWLGNIERLEATGIPVAAVHRGCNHQPCWAMAHKVRLARPDIPMLLDPSHMSGDAKVVPMLMGKVAELGLDGAMVEVHAHPEEALSDRKQQIRPDGLMSALKVLNDATKSPNDEPTAPNDTELNWLRAEIDELDETLWDTIAARMEVSKRIGEWKKAHGVAPLQPERVKVIGERLKVIGERLHLSEQFMLRIWEIIHEQSLNEQY